MRKIQITGRIRPSIGMFFIGRDGVLQRNSMEFIFFSTTLCLIIGMKKPFITWFFKWDPPFDITLFTPFIYQGQLHPCGREKGIIFPAEKI